MSENNCKEGAAGNILRKISYFTGALCGNVAKLGKVTKTKQWKEVVLKAEDLCDKVGDKTKDVYKKVEKSVVTGVHEMKESFEEGMNTLTDDVKAAGAKTDGPCCEAEVKVKGKPGVKVKTAKKKVKSKINIEKEAPADTKLEKEIENATKDVIAE